MRQRLATLCAAMSIVVAACGGSGGSTPGPASAVVPGTAGAATGTAAAATGTAAAATGTAAAATDTAAATGTAAATSGATTAATVGASQGVTGTAVISGWESSPEEGKALTATLDAFNAKGGVKADYKLVAGDYKTQMITKFSAHDVPDLFFVNAEYSQEWIDQTFLEPLDDRIAAAGFDTSQFFDGYQSIFKGKDGKTYGFAKDGNTIGLAYRSDLVTTAPKTLEELVAAATALKGKGGLKAPMCFNAGLDRALAFLYAQGGNLLSDDGKSEAISSDASKAAVQWYMSQFQNGLAMTASDLGSGWCGEALGKGQVGLIFEGGWLDPFMTGTYPDVKYAWAPVPTGSSGNPVTISFTAGYAIGADSKNKDQAFQLLMYLAGPEGMQKWTEGGVALPSRKDVPTPKGKEVLAAQSAYARPGSGFMPHWAEVQKAFQDAFTAQIQSKTFDAGPVIDATKAAITKALNQ